MARGNGRSGPPGSGRSAATIGGGGSSAAPSPVRSSMANRQLVARRSMERAASPSKSERPRRSPMLIASALALGAGLIGVVVLALAVAVTNADQPIRVPDAPLAAVADGRTMGSADAPVTIEIWSDFQCPACGMLARALEPRLIADYVVPGTVRL